MNQAFDMAQYPVNTVYGPCRIQCDHPVSGCNYNYGCHC